MSGTEGKPPGNGSLGRLDRPYLVVRLVHAADAEIASVEHARRPDDAAKRCRSQGNIGCRKRVRCACEYHKHIRLPVLDRRARIQPSAPTCRMLCSIAPCTSLSPRPAGSPHGLDTRSKRETASRSTRYRVRRVTPCTSERACMSQRVRTRGISEPAAPPAP